MLTQIPKSVFAGLVRCARVAAVWFAWSSKGDLRSLSCFVPRHTRGRGANILAARYDYA